jgi:hypothetical protein
MAEQTQQPEAQQEKQTNCPACNKPLKKVKIYYRNGKFYCTKKCWKKATSVKKDETNA